MDPKGKQNLQRHGNRIPATPSGSSIQGSAVESGSLGVESLLRMPFTVAGAKQVFLLVLVAAVAGLTGYVYLAYEVRSPLDADELRQAAATQM
jgi:hypothetical protein